MKNYSIEIKWALIFTVASLLWMTFEKLMGWHEMPGIAKHAMLTNIFGLVAIVIYIFFLREKRNKQFPGGMPWKQGFTSGLIMSAMVAILAIPAQYIVSTFITPDYFDNAIAYGITQGQPEAALKQMFNLKAYLIMGPLFAFVVGLVTTAIVALFFRSPSK